MLKIASAVGTMIVTGSVIVSQTAAQRGDGLISMLVGDQLVTLSQQDVADLLPDLKAFAGRT